MTLSLASCSCMSVDPILLISADKYNLNIVLGLGGIKTGGVIRYCLISSSTFWCSWSQLNFWLAFSFNSGVKACIFPNILEINLPIKFILPISDCSSFLLVGGWIFLIDSMLFGPTSIPLSCTINPKNCPAETPKAHLCGFIFKPYLLALCSTSHKSCMWSLTALDFTITSSI